jgi:uncharacterized protein (DUF2236 family)
MPTHAPTTPSQSRPSKPKQGPRGLPIGPESLTWKLFGDTRGLIIVGRTGVLQTMHPTISQALIDHSDYFENPLDRILRSAGPILGVIYDEQHGDTSAWVRDRHRGMKGERTDGKKYRALDPDAFWWAHATFFESQIARCELFNKPLTIEQKRQLYLETITWYSRYGLSMRLVPTSYEGFEEYWAQMFAEVLQATPVASEALIYGTPPSPFPGLSPHAWKLLGPIVGRSGPWLTKVVLPPEAQEILGAHPSAADRLAFAAFQRYVKLAWPLLPSSVKRNVGVRAADEREGYKG